MDTIKYAVVLPVATEYIVRHIYEEQDMAQRCATIYKRDLNVDAMAVTLQPPISAIRESALLCKVLESGYMCVLPETSPVKTSTNVKNTISPAMPIQKGIPQFRQN